ncbi:hypothetical protein SAMN05444360_102180 [Chryseobacterium carnipullorum]|uniref:hypothetical protein n=1 Tax=Chryseobacterium carnipullorum TaxID=1124835 RepID=UPI0009118B4C|nr:hypothetical protein [Chryseobacterium carnipullorum]SHL52341.1 hypothetical protein SAMN05444360_102180 [Chryseobacterium carnipullorum]
MTDTFALCKALESAVDTVLKIELLENNHKSWTYLSLSRVFEKMLDREFNISEQQSKSIKHLCSLIEKNYSVYANCLITNKEYNENGYVLWVKIVEKIKYITKPKIKKASKIDVYSLRASLQNINNEN